MSRPHFLRHAPADPQAHRLQIDQARTNLQAALASGDTVRTLDHAGNLGALLTSDRREEQGYDLLSAHLATAREMDGVEESAWLIHALATAAQYVGKREEADGLFAEALRMTRAHGWRRLEHFVLHHWGRSLAEQDRFGEARERFGQSLAIRVEMGDRLQDSSRRALAELERLEAGRST